MKLEEFEDVTRNSITARRNQLMAIWAGKKIGLTSEALQQYALEVHDADYEEAGCDDVVRKITDDLRRADVIIDSKTIHSALQKAEASARQELLHTD